MSVSDVRDVLRESPPDSLVWGFVAASILAVVAIGFTAANGQNAVGLVLDGSGTDLSFLWPVTAVSAFVTELLAWFFLITRRGREDYRAALVTGVVTGLAAHVPTTLGAWIWVNSTTDWHPVGVFFITLLSSLYLAAWFTIPSSVLVTTLVMVVARRQRQNGFSRGESSGNY